MHTMNQFPQSGGFLEGAVVETETLDLDGAVNALLESTSVDAKTAETICPSRTETTIADQRSGTDKTVIDLFTQRNRRN